MAQEQQPAAGIEKVEAPIKKIEGFLSGNAELIKALDDAGTKLTGALNNFREKNPDAAKQITDAVAAKVDEIRVQFLQRLGEGANSEQVVKDTRSQLAELGAVLKETPPPAGKPGILETVSAALTTTAREKDIGALAAAIGNIRIDLTASTQPKEAISKGVKNVSGGLNTLAQAPTTVLANITTYHANADSSGIKGAMKETGQ